MNPAHREWEIKKTNGKWKVVKDSEDKVLPENTIKWVLKAPDGVQAHLQFTDADPKDPGKPFLGPVEPGGKNPLTPDWTAIVDRYTPLSVRVKAVPPGPYYYAVWITPDNVFAVGDNPPPDIDVGP